MFILENSELEVREVRDIDATIQAEETIGVKGPARLSRSWELNRSNGIGGEEGANILAELLVIKDHGSSEAWSKELSPCTRLGCILWPARVDNQPYLMGQRGSGRTTGCCHDIWPSLCVKLSP